MKKIGYIIISILVIVLIVFGLKINKNIKPNTYYQVYLDGNVIGTIKSKEKLEKYINEQGKLIKDQVLKYQAITKNIDDFDSILNNYYLDSCNQLNLYKNAYDYLNYYVDDEYNIEVSQDELLEVLSGINYNVIIKKNKITNYDDVIKYLDEEIKNQYKDLANIVDKSILSEVEQYSFEEYVNNKNYDVDYSKLQYMKDYVKENEIYAYVEIIPISIEVFLFQIIINTNKIVVAEIIDRHHRLQRNIVSDFWPDIQ